MTALQRYLDGLVRDGVASAAVGLVGTAEAVEWDGVAGEARPGRRTDVLTRFDYASLTKPHAATLALLLDAGGTLPLAAEIGEVWPGAHRDLARRPLSDLLRHRSGLAGWTPLYHRCRSREEVLSLLLGGGLLGARAGTYSDLGYILWGLAAERRTGLPLADLLQERVLAPLGLTAVPGSPGSPGAPGERPDLAESRMGTGKEVELAAGQGLTIADQGPPPLGLPQDGNARFLMGRLGMGKVYGHAGLFGRAGDLWRLGAEWLAPGRLLNPGAVSSALSGGGPFALGWWRRTLRNSAGRGLSRSSFGHTGFAGTSLWLDPEAGRVYVLLTSRLDPASDMNRWRRRFHALARLKKER